VSRQQRSRVTFPKSALQWVHIDLSRFPLAANQFNEFESSLRGAENLSFERKTHECIGIYRKTDVIAHAIRDRVSKARRQHPGKKLLILLGRTRAEGN
jgi:hypothetical protein